MNLIKQREQNAGVWHVHEEKEIERWRDDIGWRSCRSAGIERAEKDTSESTEADRTRENEIEEGIVSKRLSLDAERSSFDMVSSLAPDSLILIAKHCLTTLHFLSLSFSLFPLSLLSRSGWKVFSRFFHVPLLSGEMQPRHEETERSETGRLQTIHDTEITEGGEERERSLMTEQRKWDRFEGRIWRCRCATDVHTLH